MSENFRQILNRCKEISKKLKFSVTFTNFGNHSKKKNSKSETVAEVDITTFRDKLIIFCKVHTTEELIDCPGEPIRTIVENHRSIRVQPKISQGES